MPTLLHPRLALSAFVDGRLPGWRRSMVEGHLRTCTRCALEVARIDGLRTVLRSHEVPEPPESLQERLRAIGQLDGSVPSPEPGTGTAPDAAPDAAPGTARGPSSVPRRHREHVPTAAGAAGVLVAGLLLVGTVGAGAVVTGGTVPWVAPQVRASLTGVLPRAWPWSTPARDDTSVDGATTTRPVDNGQRP